MTDESTAGDDARTATDALPIKKPDAAVLGRGETHIPDEDAVLLTDGGQSENMAYWRRNLEAALSSMEPETAVTERHNADGLVITPVGGSTREERAELIHALERRGFEITSSSEEKYIYVDVTDSRLDHPFADEDADLLTDGGHAPGHNPSANTPNWNEVRSSNFTDGGVTRFPELPGFERDILLTLARSQPTNGQELLADLSTLRDEDIGDARLYPHLNELADAGLVDKRENFHDDRSHEYRLADAGRHTLREHAQRLEGAVEALDGGQR
ncbi:hypothetical protein BRD02_01605 [Halobacteriales archaeon QS_8_69_73]|nr:MAG: hypothetical protein BRD02_01605 [Halobacteriales archaeon QS_8_69_73]